MIKLKSLLEAKSKTAVLAFGRLNPVTKGHEVLANAIVKLAKMHSADHYFYLSRSQDAKKNPLNVDQKVYYARQSFKGMNIVGASDQIRTFMEAAKSLNGKYENLIMVAGSDRVLEYKNILDKYNGKDFTFKSIVVVSAGERDPDADGAAGMSATKMRQAAADNDFNKFKLGVPSHMSASVAKKMFDDVRAGMRITEASDDVREDYINERIFNVGDVVVYEGEEYPITYRGSNYVILESNKRAWLKDITATDKVDESIMVKQQDKLKAARIIGMALGYDDAETKTDPTAIVNMALRHIKSKPLNAEAKKILARMLELAKKMEITFDDKLVNLKEAFVAKAHTDDDEKEEHNLLHKPGHVHPSNYSRLRKIHIKAHESTEDDLSDDEIEELIAEMTEDEMIEFGYDEDEFEVVNEDAEALNEVLSKIERIKAKSRMRRTAAKRERAEKIALKKRSSSPVLAKRARRLAVKALEKRLARKPLNTLSVPEKERIEAKIAKMKPTLNRIALKMLPKVRSLEKERMEAK